MTTQHTEQDRTPLGHATDTDQARVARALARIQHQPRTAAGPRPVEDTQIAGQFGSSV